MIELADIGINKSDNVTHVADLAPAYSFDFESLSSVVKTIISSRQRRIPIVDKNSHLVGILTYMDIIDAILRGISKNTKISTFMIRETVFCETTESIGLVLQKMKISRRGGFPVVKNTKLIGMVSEKDFIKLVYGKYLGIAVNELMTHRPLFLKPETTIHDCMKAMVNTHYRRFPVISRNETVGMVTGIDVLRYLNEIDYTPSHLNKSIEHIMSTPVIFVSEHDDISDAVKLIIENEVGGLPVINEENMLKGIITERDIINII